MNEYDIKLINKLSPDDFRRKLARFCGSKKWLAEIERLRPFASAAALTQAASDIWWNICNRADWIESFNSRPAIGDQESFVKDKWCLLEDEHTIIASRAVADELLRCNEPYSTKFGYIWILLCEGLTPEQQLANYKRRIENDIQTELMENSVEDFKVTMRRLRLSLLNQDPYDN